MNQNDNKLLIRKLDRLHDEDKFFEIIEIISEIPEKDRNYEIISHLARAYNNVDYYTAAIEQLLLIKDKGQKDSLWHFRMGYAYFYLGKYESALKEFKLAYELNENDDVAKLFIEASQVHISNNNIFIENGFA